MGFTITSEQPVTVEKRVLTISEKKKLTDLYIQDIDPTTAKHKTGLPRNLIKHSYSKKAAIFATVQDLMTNGYVYSEEVSHLNELGEKVIDKPEVKRQVGTISTLKTQAKKFFPDCEKESFDYNIDMIVKWHDGTGKGVWSDFVNCFK